MKEAAHNHEIYIPKGALIAAGALVVFALVAVAASRLTGVGQVKMNPPPVVHSVDLRFEDAADGSVLVYSAADNKLVDSLAPGSSGFVRVVMRGMARERRLADVGKQPPFRLARHENGQLTLTDTANNKVIDLNAFGATNQAAFARLIDKTKDGSK
ncbi:putative photosynthetic complex assembly protein [Rhodopseudomonas faecalis]|uniref:Putative photosynthetic complex assembly protein n=1 Tax=Rhodopseudomonas faecalis TaxID=99655 RepID=A0A318TDZ9_9BRAD|nr:photosynthetic complex assembly protein PuhC [Rhodopseudomonas faecalis]PYF02803.1 putative photosynthetic complex assembly protein [Rhodopseudomonas faecalis]TAH67325.1 MAG: phosphonate-binding protein [Rhodopseudomonas palustris]